MASQDYPGKGLSLSQLAFALKEELKRSSYSPFFTFDDVSQLDKDISTALADVREWRNSFLPINRVQLDVFSLIPTHLVSQKDRFRATFVCRHWRRTFLQNCTLWSQFLLHFGAEYTKTLLGRAKGSALSITARSGSPVDAMKLLPPHTGQIKYIFCVDNTWTEIQQFSDINSGPLPLLNNLFINAVDEISMDRPNWMTPPSTPLFSGAVNLKDFTLRSERFPFLSHFVFPNLTRFELSVTPAIEPGYRALELLDFLEASPVLRTVSMKIIAKVMRFDDVHLDRVVVLPNAETFSLVMDDPGAGYELAAHISCPSAKETTLTTEKPEESTLPPIIFPPPTTWSAIHRQYATGSIEEVTLYIIISHYYEPFFSCHVAFKSPDTDTQLEFKLVRNEDEDEDAPGFSFKEFRYMVFSQACKIIRDHPLLSNVKRLCVRFRYDIYGFDDLRRFSNEFGRLFQSVGSLDELEIYGCDPQTFLTPFFDFPELSNMEHPIVYPPIKQFGITHHWAQLHREESLAAIVEFAKSRHALGTPFEKMEFCMSRLPEGIAERLRPWVSELNCHVALCYEEEM